jgi:hypothetical protein
MFLLYSLSLGAPIWPIGVGGPRVRPVRTHSSYATVTHVRHCQATIFAGQTVKFYRSVTGDRHLFRGLLATRRQ